MTTTELLPPPERTVARMLARQAAVFGARPALAMGAQGWSHAQVQEMAARRASALRMSARKISRHIGQTAAEEASH